MYAPSMASLAPLGILGLLGLVASSARAQEAVPEITQGAEAADPQDEMRELFLKVERNLLRMDQYLLDASAGDTSKIDEIESAGIDDLLEQAGAAAGGVGASGVAKVLGVTRKRGDRVLEDIDRILEIAAQTGQGCSGGGNPQPSDSQSPSPTEGQGNSETERMQGNRAPGQGKPEQQGEDKPQQGEDPRGNRDSDAPPSSGQAQRMPDHPTDAPAPVTQDADRWGELPIYARDLFRAEGGRDLPPQYRDWIDAYYRRLNRRSGGD